MTPEQRAEAVLQLIESDFGQSGRDVRFLAIRDELVAVINETKDEDAEIVENQNCDQTEYMCNTIDRAVGSIRASKIKE